MIINSILKDLGMSDVRNRGQVPLPEVSITILGKAILGEYLPQG